MLLNPARWPAGKKLCVNVEHTWVSPESLVFPEAIEALTQARGADNDIDWLQMQLLGPDLTLTTSSSISLRAETLLRQQSASLAEDMDAFTVDEQPN